LRRRAFQSLRGISRFGLESCRWVLTERATAELLTAAARVAKPVALRWRI
jgi:hypothetical protein